MIVPMKIHNSIQITQDLCVMFTTFISQKKDTTNGSDEELIAKHLDELSMHVEHQLNINQTSTSAPPPDLLPLQVRYIGIV